MFQAEQAPLYKVVWNRGVPHDMQCRCRAELARLQSPGMFQAEQAPFYKGVWNRGVLHDMQMPL